MDDSSLSASGQSWPLLGLVILRWLGVLIPVVGNAFPLIGLRPDQSSGEEIVVSVRSSGMTPELFASLRARP